jgi:N-acetylated-alpha-linked acidic dipeptidase
MPPSRPFPCCIPRRAKYPWNWSRRPFRRRLTEPPIAGDRTSSKTKDELPAYNVYGADGDVTAELVYVNQGMPDDYKELERQGVSVKGRIVLTRYGGGWRGLKPKLAYEHGAVGCLIYSDPRDDGYGAGDTYPKAAIGRATPCSAVRCRTWCCTAAIH